MCNEEVCERILDNMTKHKTIIILKEWGRALVLALILALFVRTFVLQFYKVQSQNMEQTLLKGDYVLVNKLSYGARLPITLFSLPFVPGIYTNMVTLPPMRMPGFTNIKINDLLAFNIPVEHNLPIDKRSVQIKRCVGLPGDTIQIHDKKVRRNGNLFKESKNIQHNYRLVCNKTNIDNDLLKRYHISQGAKVSEIGIYEFAVMDVLIDELKNEESIRYIREIKDFEGEDSDNVYPKSEFFVYTKDFFGPVVVPYKGQEIKLNEKSCSLYKKIIEVYENNKLEVIDDEFYINGEKAVTYTIKKDYYFVLNDNRDISVDSRNWGFLPKNHIIGKVSHVCLSRNTTDGKINWSKSFHKIKE